MRRFLTIFFACLLAILFSFFMIGMILVGMASIFGSSTSEKPSVKSKSLLHIKSNTLVKSIGQNEMETVLNLNEQNSITLTDAIHSINRAREDDDISGILLEVNNSSIPAAFRNELLLAIDSFKKSGKKVYAYGTNIDQGAYHLATAADKIFVHPRGMLLLLGYSADITFYKGLMDKLGVEPQIFYAGNFKSATEPYRLKKMSDPNRLQVTELLDDFWDLMLNQIEDSRNIDSTQLANIINTGDALLPTNALENKLVDGLKYEDELEAYIAKELKWKEDTKFEDQSVSLTEYSTHASSYGSDLIAVLHMEGEITGTYNPYAVSEITAEEYLPEIQDLADNEKIKAVVVHINSPGGDAIVSDKIWHGLKKLNKVKPVITYMSSVAASGGYYIAAATREIIAQPRTVTGSIGVFMMSFNAEKLLENKLGLSFDKVKKGNLADYGSLNREMTTNEKQLTQKMVDHVYDRFIKIVQEGRKLPLEKVKEIAQGRVYSGTDAKAIGLVDKLGYLSNAIQSAAKYADLKDYKIREYPKRDNNPLNAFLKSAQMKISSNIIMNPELEAWNNTIQRLRQMNGKVMARQAFDIEIK